MLQMAFSSLPPVDSTLYHRYLKGQSLYSETTSSTLTSAEAPYACHWDLQETCRPASAAFDFIATKLSQEGLSIHLIISDQHPSAIPVWNLPYKSQITLCKIVRKACQKFNRGPVPSWMTAIASLSKRDLPNVFEAFTPDAYIIRRSMLQREIVYSSEGLTLLSIDHIYTLKQLLPPLSKSNWTSDSRNRHLSTCVDLLHRIHSVYTGKPASAAYIERVYRELPFSGRELEEVILEYNARYCTATIFDVNFQPDFAYHTPPDRTSKSTFSLPELTTQPSVESTPASSHEQVSPLEVDLDIVRIWDAIPQEPDYDYEYDDHHNNNNIPSPSSVTYPSITKPSSTPPRIPPIATASQIPFPPPRSPPPSYPLPPPPAPPPRSVLRSLPRSQPQSTPSSPDTISTYPSDDNEYYNHLPHLPPPPPAPAPLKITKRTSSRPAVFPAPPGWKGTALPLLASSVFSDVGSAVDGGSVISTGSAVDGENLWEVNVLESPEGVEGWAWRTEGALRGGWV